MRRLLVLLAVVQLGDLAIVVASGLLWSRARADFLPILAVPRFRAIHREAMARLREREELDLRGRVLRLTGFQEDNVLEFYDDDTRVTGLVGDIWENLAASMNFTLNPIRSTFKAVGLSYPNGTYSKLLNVIATRETDVIPIVETYSVRLGALDFTMPLWKSRHRFFVTPDNHYNPTWMVKIFSWKVWCATVTTHALLTVCGFISKKTIARLHGHDERADRFGEHLFYNFAMICSQSYIPANFRGRSRVVEASLSLFSSLMYIAYSTLLFNYLSKTMFIEPFTDIGSLTSETSYTIVTLEGSLLELIYENKERFAIGRHLRKDRFLVVSGVEDFYAMCCSQKRKYAMFEEENLKDARVPRTCTLQAVGIPYFNVWMASGLIRGFEKKRAIDIGILKMYESGVMTALKSRWLSSHGKDDLNPKKLEAINLEQVCVIVAIFCGGSFAAVLFFIVEIFISRWLRNKSQDRIWSLKIMKER